MKIKIYLIISIFAFAGCTNINKEQTERLKETASKDSLLLTAGSRDDSEMVSYLMELRETGENLDLITSDEKAIALQLSDIKRANKDFVLAKVKELDALIIVNEKKMNRLQIKLRKIAVKNENLTSLASHLAYELDEKTEEVIDLQTKLYKIDNSFQLLTVRLNDSICEIKKVRPPSSTVKTELNAGYFATGTVKYLQDKGIINKEGGFTRTRKALDQNPDIDNSTFEKMDLTNLKGIELNGKFKGLLTVHPSSAYSVIQKGNSDSIAITNPFVFWCESKYLVVALK